MDSIIGQDRAISQLLTLVASGRVHHAYIFHGPAGVGKMTAAVAFGRLLLCQEPQTDLAGRPVACGSCTSCDHLDRGAHPDLHVITKELAAFSSDARIRARKQMSIPVQVLQDLLIEPVYHSAQLRHGKVFIVDEAELMQDTAQNRLLKTLEEPPEQTYIILVSSSENRLLPTIRSRCHRIGFDPLPDDAVLAWIDQQAPNLDETQRQWVLLLAGGSFGQVQRVLEYNLLVWARELLPAFEAMRRGQFPADLGKLMGKLVGEYAEAWVKNHANASKDAANKQGAALLLGMVTQWSRQGLAAAAAASPVGDLETAEGQVAPYLAAIDAVEAARRELDSNVQLAIVVEHLMVQLYHALAEGMPVL